MAMTDEQIERYSRHIILKERKSPDYRCRWTGSSGSNVSGCSRRGNHWYRGCG